MNTVHVEHLLSTASKNIVAGSLNRFKCLRFEMLIIVA